MDDRITRLYRACDPQEKLAPGDSRYVDLDVARGEPMATRYARSIARADPLSPETHYFAGHVGIGKSSELLRLRKLLEDGGFVVIYFDVQDRLDVNDLHFPDLLALIADETLTRLNAVGVLGYDAVSQRFLYFWSEFTNLLTSNVALKDFSIDKGFGKVALELKNNPSKRQAIRQAIEGLGTQLLEAINDELGRATVTIRSTGRNGLVLIVDGLEKVTRRAVDPQGTTTHDRLFVDRSGQLASLNAHCVYTVPISLVYSAGQARLEQSIREFNAPLPMIRLRPVDKGPITADTVGMRAMTEIVERRCAFAGINVTAEAFEPGVVDYLCRQSGGHPRHLMAFIRGACDETDVLPLTKANATKSVNRYANSLFRQLPDDSNYLAKLKVFDAPRSTLPRDPIHMQMLYLLHLLDYMNGSRPYYEVNPVFRELANYVDA